MSKPDLQRFYIPEEQSIYLLSQNDVRKLKNWVSLCQAQLEQLGYRQIELIGKGAFGFVFGGVDPDRRPLVFKFSRITLPQHVQDRLEEESYMLGQVSHPNVPRLIAFQRIRRQAILVMERAPGIDLEQLSLQEGRLSPRRILDFARQLHAILAGLRGEAVSSGRLVVHGDIKPSNIMFDPQSERLALIDWGSSVFAQLDEKQQYVSHNVMELMSGDLHNSNARLGDVYFIGPEQLTGALSSPRFDEQGLAATLYALASGQSCRFGYRAIPPTALGLPVEFARVLTAMLDGDSAQRAKAGDYFMRNMPAMARTLVVDLPADSEPHLIPIWVHHREHEIDTVVYSSRKAFLKEEGAEAVVRDIDDVQFDRYYKNFLQGMGETEKAFLAAVGRLGKYPVVGGLAVRWEADGVYIDSSLNLHDERFRESFSVSVNNMVTLARSIYRRGVFKSCLFDARRTLHIDRDSIHDPFVPDAGMSIPYEVVAAPTPELEDGSREHSYFEDGKDPEENLVLPREIVMRIARLNRIYHTGLIIFESLETHLKVHSYFKLLDPSQEELFRRYLHEILQAVPRISGLGISGFMKMPYKDTRQFTHIDRLPERFYPRDPRAEAARH
ncbi:protein kinase domain-containing protein [Aestuariirhabdus litorea]|uniref:Serine/threonine protein kinase n=1 Tax=Aestuariirhabdus litorea TaxID=2528527 RepID=A0A3P3VP47_9GAMM|nr:protein kinase [Aestuariirhabdus litorea]RRJ84541.1 serine/threonine protein kinase [Aestuariirhabdus litorea]RWW97767.1 serine/threonine protein kinase [Endozoicomonadaceae bacterium GTF-13]